MAVFLCFVLFKNKQDPLIKTDTNFTNSQEWICANL